MLAAVRPCTRSRAHQPVASVVALVALIAVVLTACGGAAPTQTEDGQRFEVEPGERFEVVMRETPGVGENWRLASVDAVVVEQIGGKRHRHDSDLDGSSGLSTFEFEAVAPGEAELRFEQRYRGEEIIDRMAVTVVVRPWVVQP